MARSSRFFVVFAIVLSPIPASCSKEKTPDPGPKGEPDKMIAEYTEAIRLKPKDANGYYKRGVRYEELGESNKAIADFTEAIELKDQRAYVNRAAAYKKKKEYDRAIADYTRAIEFYDKHGSDLADALLRAGASAGAYFDRGICYEEKGEVEKAQADFKKAAELHPNFKDKVKNRTKKQARLKRGDRKKGRCGIQLSEAGTPLAVSRPLWNSVTEMIFRARNDKRVQRTGFVPTVKSMVTLSLHVTSAGLSSSSGGA